MLVPEGYTMREIKPADKYDVVSFARAMNDDFAPKLKKLFDRETEAAVLAQKTGKSVKVPCKVAGCNCKAYNWVPNRPEDIGEFWHQRRRNFDPTKWRAKCKCKHTHDFHDPNSRRCKVGGEEWLPFAEMPDLRNIALTGQEADDSRYLALTQGEGSIPQYQRPVGNDAAVNFGASGSRGGGGRGGASGGSGFRPVYD
nr:hypothetical protein BaRGS_028740 [Batillaria attramentaria]